MNFIREKINLYPVSVVGNAPVTASKEEDVVQDGMQRSYLWYLVYVAYLLAIIITNYSSVATSTEVVSVSVSGLPAYAALLANPEVVSPVCPCTATSPLRLGKVATINPASAAYSSAYSRGLCSSLARLSQNASLLPAALRNNSSFPSARSRKLFFICEMLIIAEKQSLLGFANVNVPFLNSLVRPQDLADFAATSLGDHLILLKTTTGSVSITYNVLNDNMARGGIEDTTPMQYFFVTETSVLMC